MMVIEIRKKSPEKGTPIIFLKIVLEAEKVDHGFDGRERWRLGWWWLFGETMPDLETSAIHKLHELASCDDYLAGYNLFASTISSVDTYKSELHYYLKEIVLARTKIFDILERWKATSLKQSYFATSC
uniref:Uncharacterized protein n=1 Tax=Lactuca sativa TaxID=4236 RepID=A0A9R1X1H7_LACSA|nr:hypothetical protein LSAT_V11C700366130 [Lactuca sativa]